MNLIKKCKAGVGLNYSIETEFLPIGNTSIGNPHLLTINYILRKKNLKRKVITEYENHKSYVYNK